MFRFVLRDNFEQCKKDVKATIAADEEAGCVGTVQHAKVMEEVRAIIACVPERRAAKPLEWLPHADRATRRKSAPRAEFRVSEGSREFA